MSHLLGDLALSELPYKWFDFSWTIYWVNKLYLNCLLSDLTPPTGSPNSTWTVYCFTCVWLNCWLVNLTLAELSSSWFELSWNCVLGDLTLLEQSICWGWIVYGVTGLLVDFTTAELSTSWLDCGWTVYWLTWL